MWYDDYEPSEPSEIDSIVDETIAKITDYIIKNSKFDIDKITSESAAWEKKYNECKTENRKFFSDLMEKDRQIKELTNELDRKRTQLGILPFEPGEEVYFIFQNNSTSCKFTCPRCNGKGRVTVKQDGIDYNAICPSCNDSIYSKDYYKREDSYNPYEVACRPITQIDQTVTYDSKRKEVNTVTKYIVSGYVTPFEHIRKKVDGGVGANQTAIKELETIAAEINMESRNKCMRAVGREEEK